VGVSREALGVGNCVGIHCREYCQKGSQRSTQTDC
jgi:hypothetical protein